MNYRHAEILAPQDLGVAGTKIIDIDLEDVVSRITVVFKPVGGSTTILGHPVLGINKIELIDGSDVLHSLSGKEGQALNIFDSKNPVVQEIDYRVGGTPMIYYNLDFGRWLWDPELGFDPKKFKNPQLKLTWNEIAYDASVTSHAFIVYGHVFDEKTVSPRGFLMPKEIKSYAGVAGSYEYTDMPTDYVLRKLMLKGELAGSGVRAVIEDIRLSENNDKCIPMDGDIHDLRSFLDPLVPDAVDIIRATVAATSTTLFCTPHNLASVVQSVDTPDVVPSSGACSGGRFWAEMETAPGNVQFQIRGKNPHGCICIPFGNQDDPDDWYDVTKLGNLKLRLKGGSGAPSSTTRIVTQQLRMY